VKAVHHCTRHHTEVASLWCSVCATKVLTYWRGVMTDVRQCSWQHTMVTSLWYTTCSSWWLKRQWGGGKSLK